MKIKYLGQQSTPALNSYSPDFLDCIPRNNQHLNNFFGLVSLIIKFPYDDDSIFAWDSSGNSIPLIVD